MTRVESSVAWWGRRSSRSGALDRWAASLPEAWREPVDLHVVGMLATRSETDDPDLWLAWLLAVRAPRQGHVCLDLDDLGLLSREVEPEHLAGLHGVEDRLRRHPLVGADLAAGTPFVLDGRRLYAARWFAYERRLADGLAERFAARRRPHDPALLARGLQVLFPRDPGMGTAVDRQQLAAAMAVLRGAAVVSGGPGTGKTWTVRNLLVLLYAQWASQAERGEAPRIAVAAPTGKAAARVVQSIRAGLEEAVERAAGVLPPGVSADELRSWLDALPPWTIHRLLGFRPDAPTRFRHDTDNPLPYDVVLVDEASMVDVALMAKLVAALSPDARLVLLGDRNQLASVEAGTVLADLCGGARAAEEIVRLSTDMREALATEGGLVLPDEAEGWTPVSVPGPWDGIAFLTRSRRFDARSGIGQLARACVLGDVDTALAVARPWTGDPGRLVLDDTPSRRVVGPDVGRMAPTPTGRLSKEAQAFVVRGYREALRGLSAGPPADGEGRVRWIRGLLDDFERFRVLAAHRRGPLGVESLNEWIVGALAAEGLIDPASGRWFVGRPLLVTRNDHALGRFNGDVGLVVPAASGEGVRVAFPHGDHAVEELSPSRLPDHETVFAMTIHKSQGSEHDDVVVVLPPRPSPILTRELVYTGVTRARKRVTLVGSEPVLRAALDAKVTRATGLADRLWAEAEAQ